MISFTSAARRAEEFAAATEGRRSADTLRPELAALLDVVETLRDAPAPQPRPEFVSSLRETLLAEARSSVQTAPALALPRRGTGTRERRLALAASAFVLVGGTAGVAAAAQHSLPGEALYPLKRGIETLHADLSTSSAGKGSALLDQARVRLHELEALLASDPGSPSAGDTLDTFLAQATEGSQLLLDDYADRGDATRIDTVRSFAEEAMGTLATLESLAPAELRDDLAAAADTVQRIDADATAACSTCAAGKPVLQLPTAFAAESEAQRALLKASTTPVDNDHPTLGGIKQPVRETAPADGATPAAGEGPAPATDPSTVLPDVGDTLGSVTDRDAGSTETSGGGLVPDPDKVTEDVDKGVKNSTDGVTSGSSAATQDLDPGLEQFLP